MGDAGIWATCNVGASKPEDYGLYFKWGATIGYTPNQVTSGDFSKSKHVTDSKNLTLEQDAAYVYMGSNWRIPTSTEINNLINNTVPGDGANSYGWIEDYKGTGVKGALRKSKNNGNEIFFPAAGYAYNSSMNDVGSIGRVWSKTWGLYDTSYYLSFNQNLFNYSSNYRGSGYTIRAILDLNIIPPSEVNILAYLAGVTSYQVDIYESSTDTISPESKSLGYVIGTGASNIPCTRQKYLLFKTNDQEFCITCMAAVINNKEEYLYPERTYMLDNGQVSVFSWANVYSFMTRVNNAGTSLLIYQQF